MWYSICTVMGRVWPVVVSREAGAGGLESGK